MKLAIELHFLKESSELVGLWIVSQPQTEAEMFCMQFLDNYHQNIAQLAVKDDGLELVQDIGNSCYFAVSKDCTEQVKALLKREGRLSIQTRNLLTPGFILTKKRRLSPIQSNSLLHYRPSRSYFKSEVKPHKAWKTLSGSFFILL